MADVVVTPTIAAACSAATGVLCYPILAAFGVDVAAMGAGLLGCTIMQTFIKKDGQTIQGVAMFTVGSVVFASLMAPMMTPWVMVKLGEWYPTVPFPHDSTKAATAGFLGAFAQPLVMFAKKQLSRLIEKLSPKGAGDA